LIDYLSNRESIFQDQDFILQSQKLTDYHSILYMKIKLILVIILLAQA